jgi:type II secretory pathway component GspD/PulD (secretin)
VQVQGDELIIISEDEDALDRFEDMLSDALTVVPPTTTWTVFTLQSADATQASAMLEQLIPDATVAQVASTDGGIFGGLSSSFSSMGSSLMSATGLSNTTAGGLRIIPEPRLNALFVSGPSAKVQEVEDFLEILDASDWPGTLRDRVPHMIPVLHAEVTDVHRIVRDVYKDYIEGEQGGGNPFGGGGNALAMFMGGGRGGRDNNENNRQQRDIQLTVGMDEQTSHLIVSADEGLYQEIKELVESLDNAALQARRTIRVVALQNANTAAVQNTLGAVMPRVKVSTSGARTSSSSSSAQSTSSPSPASSNNGSAPQQGPNPDQIRQFWEQRMRERGQSGQSSGDSGRGSFFGRDRGDSGRGSFSGGDRGGRGR